MGTRGFAGNKSFLEQKPCQCCGKAMTWRKSWAKNWEQVRYCSDRCSREAAANRRRSGSAAGAS
jgi:hypothetical protein